MEVERKFSTPQGLVGRTLIVVSICMVFILSALLLGYAADVFLSVFAGILLAIWLRSLSEWVAAYTRLPGPWSYAAVLVALAASVGLSLWWLAPHVGTQLDKLLTTLPETVNEIQQKLQQYTWGQALLSQTQQADELAPSKSNLVANVTNVFSISLGFVTNVVIVFFLGLFLAATPASYTAGLLALLPTTQRPRAEAVLQTLEHTLRWWLLGQFLAMGTVGVLVALGLWMLGVPLAFTLGLVAAGLAFIPYIGPVLSLFPAVLLALSQSPLQALYVLLLYVAVQGVESYLLTPLIHRRTLSLPPALTLSAQVLLGVLVGGIGLALATPLAAAGLVLVKTLYIEDILGETMHD